MFIISKMLQVHKSRLIDLPNYERRRSWKLVNVLVNGEECDNYDEALNHLEYVLKSL